MDIEPEGPEWEWQAEPSDEQGWGERHGPGDIDPQEAKLAACIEFLDELKDMYTRSKISAENYSVLCFWAAKGGMEGEVKRHGVGPGRTSGHYSRHLKSVFGMADKSDEHYTLKVPGQFKNDFSRTLRDLQVVPIHEIAEMELQQDPTLLQHLDDAVAKRELPESYLDNPIQRLSSFSLGVVFGRSPIQPLRLRRSNLADQ